ncbi:MAG: aspartate carbamoyltransferase catalytic subunit [Coriobacteriales bacterium]|jgi:aspartate carbamoyltransferase catalytic subunit|nr:aspartate carbamoyltransferase catalytic subunit [Coriobacteriales bacterium]
MMSTLSSKHLLTMSDLSCEDIYSILNTARTFKVVNDRAIKKLPTLRGRTVVNLFLEPSTRTRTSFEIAAKRLSADGINFAASASATTKGESLIDTAQTLDAMDCDLVVIRHRYAGAPHTLTQHMRAHIINGGDGKHQHPTQALLDLFTMREHFGHIQNLNVAIVGDIAHSRVFGSLAPALVALGAQVTAIAPPTLLPARPDALGAQIASRLDEVIADFDVIYMLRIQQERIEESPFPSLREYAMLYGINASRLARMKPDAIIMHPGPVNRGVELSSEAVDTARNLLLYQVNAGVAVRMALMYLLLGGEQDGLAA